MIESSHSATLFNVNCTFIGNLILEIMRSHFV
nr:MAG TPA: hypothetical protein [Caudoviricetes sp.]